MPPILRESFQKYGHVLVWQLTESESELLRMVNPDNDQQKILKSWSPGRRKEWLGGRWLIHEMTGFRQSELHIDKYGKPHLKNDPRFISLSHSGPLLALVINDCPVGIDVQEFRDSIAKVAHKFCTPDEHNLLAPFYSQSIQEHIIWSSKESIYKAYGKRQLDFLKHIRLNDVSENDNYCDLTGHIVKDDINLSFHIYTRPLLNAILAIAVQVG